MPGMFKYIGPFYNYGVQYRLKLGHVMPVGPGYCQRQGNSRALCQQMAFVPVFFPLSVGFFPAVSSAKGALVIQPPAFNHVQSMPVTSSYFASPAFQKD
jgi:hypothetical protein